MSDSRTDSKTESKAKNAEIVNVDPKKSTTKEGVRSGSDKSKPTQSPSQI